jgi:outer membrane protein TolC
VNLDPEILADLVRQQNPDLRKIKYIQQMEHYNIARAKKNYFPDLTIGIDYIDTDEAMMPLVKDSGKDPVIAMMSVNVPLWIPKYKAQIRAAQEQLHIAEEEYLNTQNLLTAQLEVALFHFKDASRRINLYRNTLIPKAKQSLGVAQQAFTTGSVDFLELIDAQRMLLDFELGVEKALMEKSQRISEIEMITGKYAQSL